MKYALPSLKSLISQGDIQTMLDIGAGKGYASLFAASYDIAVDAVEPNIMKRYRFPRILENHPHICYHSMQINDFVWCKKYDIIWCINVLMFLSREYVLGDLMRNITDHCNPGGYMLLSFFDDKDKTIPDMSCYTVEDFQQWNGWELVHHEELSIEENHPPLGKHCHYIHFLIIKKTLPSDKESKE